MRSGRSAEPQQARAGMRDSSVCSEDQRTVLKRLKLGIVIIPSTLCLGFAPRTLTQKRAHVTVDLGSPFPSRLQRAERNRCSRQRDGKAFFLRVRKLSPVRAGGGSLADGARLVRGVLGSRELGCSLARRAEYAQWGAGEGDRAPSSRIHFLSSSPVLPHLTATTSYRAGVISPMFR